MLDKYNKNVFAFFSVIGFLIIFVASFITYIVSAYQINRTVAEQLIKITEESIKLNLTKEISGELSLLQNLGRSPIIREYFLNPTDSQLEQYALNELIMFQNYSSEGIVFYVSDVNKIFYSTGNDPYVVDPDLEENYWYNLTLYETVDLNFNINYNPDIDKMLLWINIPVYDFSQAGEQKPIGLLGTGLNLTKTIELVEQACYSRSPNIHAYLFNKYHELTIADHLELVENKTHIDEYLGYAGHEIVDIAAHLQTGEDERFIYGKYMYHIAAIDAVKDWFLVLQYDMPGVLALTPQMNWIFFGMLSLILILLIVMNYIVYKTNRDISNQNTRLHNTNDTLNLVVQATKIGLLDATIVDDDVINPNMVFNWSNEFRNMLGFENTNDFPNLLGSLLDLIHPDDKDRVLECYVAHIKDKTGLTPFDPEYRIMKKNGVYEYFRSHGATSRDEYGVPLRIAGSLMNVTETKNMLIDLENQRTLAQAANKAKSDFLAKISHEIRTPMNAIIGISQIQLQNYNKQDSFSEALEKIYNSGCNLLGIINDILDLSKIESGKMDIIPIEYYVPSLIHDAAQLNILQIGSKQLEFILDIDENLPAKLIGDELRIKQILNNLLSNAIKYSTKGHVKLSMQFSNYSEMISDKPEKEIYLHIVVEDTGQGLKPEDCEKLFSEYMRFNIKETRTVQGTGIGLNITKSLIELMGGTIKVESEYGIGSKFTVSIKQETVDYEPIGKELVKQLGTFTFTGKKHQAGLQITREVLPYGKVLIVDDVETNLYVAEGLMIPYKLHIETVLSGPEAIDLIKNGKVYDVIFMDHMMPMMDGIEATNIIRSIGYQGVIVALTANAISGNAEMFKKNGFDDFISKPIDIRILNNILNTYIRDRYPEEHLKYKNIEFEIEAKDSSASKHDQKIMEIFKKDLTGVIKTLKETTANQNLKLFTTTVHGVKAVLASIGNQEAANKAAELEQAGLNKDIEFILEKVDDFILNLENILKNLQSDDQVENLDDFIQEDETFLIEQLNIIGAACESCDDTTAFAALERLNKLTWKKNTLESLGKIYDNLYLHSDFDETTKEVVELKKILCGTLQ